MPHAPRPLVRAGVLAPMFLALTLGQLALGHAGVVAGALALALSAHGHGHALSLLADAGHVDIVFHHDAAPDRHDRTSPGLCAHEGDHLVHATTSESARDGARRTLPPALATAGVPAPGIRTPAARTRHAPVAALAAASLLRTTVLRV